MPLAWLPALGRMMRRGGAFHPSLLERSSSSKSGTRILDPRVGQCLPRLVRWTSRGSGPLGLGDNSPDCYSVIRPRSNVSDTSLFVGSLREQNEGRIQAFSHCGLPVPGVLSIGRLGWSPSSTHVLTSVDVTELTQPP